MVDGEKRKVNTNLPIGPILLAMPFVKLVNIRLEKCNFELKSHTKPVPLCIRTAQVLQP